jgi:hypothetical protein
LENLESLLDQDSRWQRDALSPASSATRGARDALRSWTQADHYSQGKADRFQHAAWGRMLRSALLQPRAANKLDRPNARGRAPEVEKYCCSGLRFDGRGAKGRIADNSFEHWRSLRQVYSLRRRQGFVLYAGTHSRGGSNSLLWVSEWGTIQATDIARSEEILTGALPWVGDGICVIESTWRGGRHGHLWGLVGGFCPALVFAFRNVSAGSRLYALITRSARHRRA